MKCVSCGAEIPGDSRFCPSCGRQQLPPAAQVCDSCGRKINPGQIFCTSCGTRIETDKTLPAQAGIPLQQQVPPFQPPPQSNIPPFYSGSPVKAGPVTQQEVRSVGAGVGARAVATIIDCVILMIISYILAAMSGSTNSGGFELTGGPFFLMCLIGLAYYMFFEGTRGATPGKMVVGLKVVKADGSKCDLGAAAIRTVLRLVDGFLFYLVAAIIVWTSPAKQRLGDRVANTLVVGGGKVKFTGVGDHNYYNFDE